MFRRPEPLPNGTVVMTFVRPVSTPEVMKKLCPPFADLNLPPPQGMENVGAVVRGLFSRAHRFGDTTHTNSMVEVEVADIHERPAGGRDEM